MAFAVEVRVRDGHQDVETSRNDSNIHGVGTREAAHETIVMVRQVRNSLADASDDFRGVSRDRRAATGRYIGEGFDDARLDTLFLASPVSWKGTLVQYTGRLHRLHPAKREVRIYDYVDRHVPMLLRMFEKRLRGYRAIGYARGEAPLGYPESKEALIVEYDDDVLRALDHESATDRGDDFAEWVP